MTSFTHKQILSKIPLLDKRPSEEQALAKWLKASAHINFIKENTSEDELIIYASSPSMFIHAVVVPNDNLLPLDQSDLLKWSHNAHKHAASVWWKMDGSELGIERGIQSAGAKSLKGGMNLIFMRHFEGWNNERKTQVQLLQEFEHIAEIRWRSERSAYCKFDENGDFDDIASVRIGEERDEPTLISLKHDALVEYLVASEQSIVQMFDFTLVEYGNFPGWQDGEEVVYLDDANLFYRQNIVRNEAAYTRGVQILKPQMQRAELVQKWSNPYSQDDRGVEFIAFDFRHSETRRISTAPRATTNYFAAHENDLPFELSPAFFRPEVLSKYKADKDKYTISERDIYCRAAWRLKGYDVNEAGQVHAYICDIADLPYQEQLHWQAYNEEPKTGISDRALANDFQNKWWTGANPFREMMSRVRSWHDERVTWWKLRDSSLLDTMSLPLTDSRTEWAECCMDITKLVNEGFVIKSIREVLSAHSIHFKDNEQSLSLLEKLLADSYQSSQEQKLSGMRQAQEIRSKVKGHAGSSKAQQLAISALEENESFADHVQSICELIIEEMTRIEQVMS